MMTTNTNVPNVPNLKLLESRSEFHEFHEFQHRLSFGWNLSDSFVRISNTEVYRRNIHEAQLVL